MLLRPSGGDLRVIAFYLGRVVWVIAIAGLVPLVWAVAAREWAPASSFLFMIGVAATLAASTERWRPIRHGMAWGHGIVAVALVWLVVPAVGTIPLVLSGHYGRLLDAYFDAMSGLTTTGLSLIQDLDHLAESVNLWRSVLQFLGGQGIVLAALTFFAGGGILALYQGEAREDRILPNVSSTARFIWQISMFHGLVGISALWAVASIDLGFRPTRGLFHAVTIFMSAFDTGGFTPQSTSIAYYHSAGFEAVAALLMIAGALSFGVHYALFRGPRNILGNLEIRTILTSFGVTLLVALVGLTVTGFVTNPSSLTRIGLFQMLSAHTGTGFATLSNAELGRWSGLAFAGMATAMALGGMASSTSGGVKSLRVGLTVKALSNTIKEALLPEHAVVRTTYEHRGTQHLTDKLSTSVMAVSLLYVGLYLLGTAVAFAYGSPLHAALFESVSASANVGLSVGITNPTMPIGLELVYLLQMWAGRLEFVAAFALVGFVVAWVVGE